MSRLWAPFSRPARLDGSDHDRGRRPAAHGAARRASRGRPRPGRHPAGRTRRPAGGRPQPAGEDARGGLRGHPETRPVPGARDRQEGAARMSARPHETTAELRKLAHALDVPTERLGMVADLPVEDLRTLRMQVSDALFEADRPAFARVAALSKAVPGAVAAKLTEAVLPPLIAARTAELLDPHRAVDMVGRLSEKYLAEVALRMDASRAPQVVEAIPPERVGVIARELARREEGVVIGGGGGAGGPPAPAPPGGGGGGGAAARGAVCLRP